MASAIGTLPSYQVILVNKQSKALMTFAMNQPAFKEISSNYDESNRERPPKKALIERFIRYLLFANV